MKVIKWIVLFLAAVWGSAAHAACTGITGGMTEAQVVSAVNACSTAGGGVVNATAGTYGPFASTFTLPCGVSISGPVVTYSHTHYQTAIFQGSAGFTGVPIHTSVGCPASQSISYLEWNGEQSNGSGGFVYVNGGTTNLTIDHDWMHGATGGAYPGNNSEAQVFFAGFGGNLSTPTTNVTVTMNEFGPEGSAADCGAAMTETSTSSGGGYCVGVMFNGYIKNSSVDHNNFHYLEQGMKVVEATTNGGQTQNSGNTNGLFVGYNTYDNIQRIPFETQSNYYTTAFPTLQTINYNVLGNRYNGAGGQQNFDFSIANGCGNPPSTPLCTANVDYNVDIQNVQNAQRGAGNEFWGDSNSHANGWLMEGFVAGAGGGFDWAQSGQFTFNNNIFNITSGSGTNCVSTKGGYWNNENNPVGTPVCTGNTYSNVGTGTYTSVQPTVTPGGAFTGTQTVAFTNPGTGLNANTSTWYTTDGTTPVPGQGTAKIYTVPFTLSATTTVNYVGMWGAINQPYSYPTNYGFVPSAMGTVTYTATSGTPTIVSGYLSTSPTNGINTATVGGATVQMIPVVNYSNGTTNASIAPTACTWTTLSGGTSVFSVSSSGVVTATGGGSDNVLASCSGIPLSQWTIAVTAPAGPTLTGITISPMVVFTTKPSGISAVGTFSDGSIKATTAVWQSSNPSVVTVDNTGALTPTGIGSSILSATASGFTAQASVVVPPNVLYPNPVATNFTFQNANFGCFAFQRLTVGTYTLVVNADGTFTITSQ